MHIKDKVCVVTGGASGIGAATARAFARAGARGVVVADLGLLKPVIDALGPKAKLHEVAGGDHSFAVLKRSGRTNEEALNEVLDTLTAWSDKLD